MPRLFREGREVTFARWLRQLDDDCLRRQPFLAAMGAWMHTIQGRVGDAERMATSRRARNTATRGRPAPRSTRRPCASVRALIARDGLDAALADARAGRRAQLRA